MQAEKKVVMTGAYIGKSIMKQFDAGLFQGTVMTATKMRGKFLYHIEYEDGDSEDFNENEISEAYELFTLSLKSKEVKDQNDIDIDEDCSHSGGETEGSEYGAQSNEDDLKKARKKRRTSLQNKQKEKGTLKGRNKSKKEEDCKAEPIKTGQKNTDGHRCGSAH